MGRDGKVWSWRGGAPLGNGTKIAKVIPTQVDNLNNIVSISSNYHHNLALEGDGTTRDKLVPVACFPFKSKLSLEPKNRESKKSTNIKYKGNKIKKESLKLSSEERFSEQWGLNNVGQKILKQNIYCNTKEIPNNGIDDDSNGYINDIKG